MRERNNAEGWPRGQKRRLRLTKTLFRASESDQQRFSSSTRFASFCTAVPLSWLLSFSDFCRVDFHRRYNVPLGRSRMSVRRTTKQFSEILRNSQFFKPIFCEKFEIAAVQKDANLVELEKCCQTHILLQNFVLIQPRTSPPKICKIFEKCIFRKCILDQAGYPGREASRPGCGPPGQGLRTA